MVALALRRGDRLVALGFDRDDALGRLGNLGFAALQPGRGGRALGLGGVGAGFGLVGAAARFGQLGAEPAHLLRELADALGPRLGDGGADVGRGLLGGGSGAEAVPVGGRAHGMQASLRSALAVARFILSVGCGGHRTLSLADPTLCLPRWRQNAGTPTGRD